MFICVILKLYSFNVIIECIVICLLSLKKSLLAGIKSRP